MNDRRSNPPRGALWLLRHACPGDSQALAGDLIERFREGQTPGWLWKQVFIACAVGILTGTRRHWPQVCYAIAGTAMPFFLWKTIEGLPGVLRWYALPWPWSQFIFELSRTIVLALAALPVLAAGLVINQAFRWISLLRTAMINLTLITLGKYLLDFVLAAFPWLLRPTAEPHLFTILLLPPVFLLLLFFSSFLVSAWLGCRAPQRATPAPNL